MKKIKTVYLAGKITGDPGYADKFRAAKERLEQPQHDFIVLSPAILPLEGFDYGAYMRMSSAMLSECDAVCFLPDWRESPGAKVEMKQAVKQGKAIFFYDEWAEEQNWLYDEGGTQ